MFDLDKSLAAWRSSYTQRRAFSADDLDELEQHIRDQVAEGIAQGETPQIAFERAMKDMGAWDAAEQEYGKVFWHKAKRQRRLSEELNWRYAMFKSYFLVALRAMRKQKSYTFINTFGLAIGLACFILIILFVKHEFAYDRFYENSDNIYRIIVQEPDDFYLGFFTLLALLISSLGLFGLAAFAAEQRTKEIGIRKVLGASTGKITLMLSREFTGLVVISTVLAVPIAYFAMQRWLERFAYHIDIGPGVFLFTGLLTLAIAILTVSYQSVKAAIANPVKSLRS